MKNDYSTKQRIADLSLSLSIPSIVIWFILSNDWVRGNFDDPKIIFGLLALALLISWWTYKYCRRYVFYGIFTSLFLIPLLGMVIMTMVFMNWG